MKPKISIIIPCYNVEKYIERCAKSLIQQSIGIENLELIFVNDASTDSTLSMLIEIEKEYPNYIMVINSPENCKQGAARNIGLEYANADFVGFIDSDDWIERDMYEKLYLKINQYDCDLVECGMFNDYPNGNSVGTAKGEDILWKINTVKDRKKLWIEDWGCGSGCFGKLYRKSLIVDNKILFPEHLKYEDNYWDSMIKLYIKSAYALKENLYHYCINVGSTIQGINAPHHLNRLSIELMKIDTYKEKGIFDIYHDEIEVVFLNMFYVNSLHILISKFNPIPVNVIKFMQKTVLELFPSYKYNQYFINEASEYNQTLIFLKTVEQSWDEEQWNMFGNEYRKLL